MCQVGAYGMAIDGASYEAILKKYYRGIELKKLY
jgi:peptidoglycan hydrolase-like amidase